MDKSELATALEQREIRRVLIIGIYCDCFAGSQLVIRDLAHVFREAGADVTVAACRIAEPMGGLMRRERFVVHDLYDRTISARFSASTFDLVWGHHWPAVGAALLCHSTRYRYLVLSSLSPFEPLEALWLLREEADALVVNSYETAAAQDVLKDEYLFRRCHVLPNSLPAAWFDDPPAQPAVLRRLLAVSNHAPAPLWDALDLLEQKGIEIVRCGLKDEARLVEREEIDRVDAVVSIGHTVPKAVARRRPVFIYDRFGGPGWLLPEQMRELRRCNFSGRGSGERSSPVAIASEISDGFERALGGVEQLASAVSSEHNLALNLGCRHATDRPLRSIGSHHISLVRTRDCDGACECHYA